MLRNDIAPWRVRRLRPHPSDAADSRYRYEDGCQALAVH